MKVERIEIIRFCDGNKDRQQIWRDISLKCQEMSNRIWQLWEFWHLQHGTPQKIRESLAAYKQWCDDGKKGKSPKDNLTPVSPELSKHIQQRLLDEFPGVSTRTRNLLYRKIEKTILKRKAAKGALAGWKAILLCRERHPSFTDPLPIPIDKQNTRTVAGVQCPIVKDGDEYYLFITIQRGDDGKHHYEKCKLKVQRKWSCRATLDRILSGEYLFKGSQLTWNRRQGKWYVMLGWEPAEAEQPKVIDSDSVAVVCHGATDPWIVLMDRYVHYRGGMGKNVTATRRNLTMQRFDRQRSFRYASANAKSHGRTRATDKWTRYQTRWNDFVRTYTQTVCKQIVSELVCRGIGTLIYLQPTGSHKDSRFLSIAGKTEKRESTSWNYFAAAGQLHELCQESGINCLIQKTDDTKGWEQIANAVRDTRRGINRKRHESRAVALKEVVHSCNLERHSQKSFGKFIGDMQGCA